MTKPRTGEAVPAVSVIVPVYNRADTLPRSLESVLSQDFNDFELIVVDDGSSDGTGGVVKGIGDPRVRCVSHDRNRGEAAARNSGVQAGRAPLIAWLDSDDEWLPGKLSLQVGLMQQDPGVTACCSDYYLHRSSSGREDLVDNTVPPVREEWLKDLYLGSRIGLGTTLIVRRDIQEEVGLFDETLTRHTDWDWLVRYAQRHLITAVRRPLARVHYNTVHVSGRDVERSARQFVDKHREDIDALGFMTSRKIIGKRWLETSRFFFEDRDYGRGIAYLFRTLATGPFQRPGLYLQTVDAAFGTGMAPKVTALGKALAGRTGGSRH